MADTPDTEAGRPARVTDDGVFDAPARELFAARRGDEVRGPADVDAAATPGYGGDKAKGKKDLAARGQVLLALRLVPAVSGRRGGVDVGRAPDLVSTAGGEQLPRGGVEDTVISDTGGTARLGVRGVSHGAPSSPRGSPRDGPGPRSGPPRWAA